MLCLLHLCESKGRVQNLAPRLFDWSIVTVRNLTPKHCTAQHTLGEMVFVSVCVSVAVF